MKEPSTVHILILAVTGSINQNAEMGHVVDDLWPHFIKKMRRKFGSIALFMVVDDGSGLGRLIHGV